MYALMHPIFHLMLIPLLIQDIGCAVGSIIVFLYGEHIGRKRMIMAGAFIMLIGTVRL
jgi:MFS family permease